MRFPHTTTNTVFTTSGNSDVPPRSLKINLYLRVCGKLPNGYHEIETLFLPLNDPADELEISFRDDERG